MRTVEDMTKRIMTSAIFALASAATVLTLSACGTAEGPGLSAQEQESGGWRASPSAEQSGASPMLFLGDSVAAQLALPLGQAMAESGAYFVDGTSTGGGNVVGPNAESTWRELPQRVEEAADGVVVYQLTTYDWGTPTDQEKAYNDLADAAAQVDADLLLVSMPPIEADEFYADHMDELASAHDAARKVADERDSVEFLDASQVWGEEYSRERDGRTDRSDDGVHVCPQGAARYASWLTERLAEGHVGFTPAPSEKWANSGWASDGEFVGCG